MIMEESKYIQLNTIIRESIENGSIERNEKSIQEFALKHNFTIHTLNLFLRANVNKTEREILNQDGITTKPTLIKSKAKKVDMTLESATIKEAFLEEGIEEPAPTNMLKKNVKSIVDSPTAISTQKPFVPKTAEKKKIDTTDLILYIMVLLTAIMLVLILIRFVIF